MYQSCIGPGSFSVAIWGCRGSRKQTLFSQIALALAGVSRLEGKVIWRFPWQAFKPTRWFTQKFWRSILVCMFQFLPGRCSGFIWSYSRKVDGRSCTVRYGIINLTCLLESNALVFEGYSLNRDTIMVRHSRGERLLNGNMLEHSRKHFIWHLYVLFFRAADLSV